MPRANPISSAAKAIERKPSTKASTVPASRSPPSSSGGYAHHEEDRGELVEVPVEAKHANDEGHEGEHDGDEHRRVAGARPGAGDRRRARGRYGHSRAARVEHRSRDPDDERGDQECQAKLPAGEELELGDLLGDADLKGIDGAERCAYRRGPQAHRHRHDGIEAQPGGEQEEDRDEGDQLLLHLDQHPAGGEGEPGHRNHQQSPALERGRQRVDQRGRGRRSAPRPRTRPRPGTRRR